MNTNDPQAEYGKREEYEPLLSGGAIAEMAAAYTNELDGSEFTLYDMECAYAKGADDVMDIMKAKIASDDLK